MKRIQQAFFCIFALAFAANCWGVDRRAVSGALNHIYDGKIVALRKFRGGSFLRYSQSGGFIKGGQKGPWTLDALILVKDVRAGRDGLQIQGERIALVYDADTKNLRPYIQDKVTIEIATSREPESIARLQRAISQAFLAGDDKLADFVPGYWKPYLLHTNSDLWPWTFAQLANLCSGDSAGLDNVRPASEIYSPNPPYPPFARLSRIQGTVVLSVIVGTDGRVKRVEITKHVAPILDNGATATVRTWRFTPATINGEPLMERAEIELNFSVD